MMNLREDLAALVQSGEYRAIPAPENTIVDIQHWMVTKLLPYLKSLQDYMYFDAETAHLVSEIARRDALMRRVLPDSLLPQDQITAEIVAVLAKVPVEARDFDFCWGFVEHTFRNLPTNIARVRSEAKRAAYIDAAKGAEPAAREVLQLKAELDRARQRIVDLETNRTDAETALETALAALREEKIG